jgi:NAD+ diphosphatase
MSGSDSTSLPACFSFVEGALDRADALRDKRDVLDAYWSDARVLRIDGDGRTLADDDGRLATTRGGDLDDAPGEAVFLGMRGDEAWFALRFSDEVADAQASRRVDLRAAAAHWSPFESTVFAQARAVLHWRQRYRFCGACGGILRFERGGWQGHCASCGLEHYPRTDPAVIVAVTDGDRLLLGRQASWPARRYSTLAGFVEPGETLEQAVAREVMEESGVRVRTCRYLGSQPWPFPSSLMLGFIAAAEPDPPQANEELEDARWFGREEVGAAQRGETADAGLLVSPSISISRWLIECWYSGIESVRLDLGAV